MDKGIEVIEVHPAYTSLIGKLKYVPQFNWTKDVAAAYVIARRSLGIEEEIPKAYKSLLRETKTCSSESTDGRNLDGMPIKLSKFNWSLWRVLEAAVLTAHFPDRHLYRCLSPLKRILVSLKAMESQ